MNALTNELISQLATHLSDGSVLSQSSDIYPYAFDNSGRKHKPDAVVLASTLQDVIETAKFCHKHEICLTARGRGTGTTGACLPVKGGVVLSCERLNKIIEISSDSRYAIVETGVLNQTLQDCLAPLGFFWAPDPSSASACTIGGNLALNSSGPRAVKYGSVRENVLGLEAVSATGELLKVGTQTTKNSVGFDLTRLMVGSEGMLGLITKAIVKITPLPEQKITFRVFYSSVKDCVDAIASVMAQPYCPCALEFIDDACLAVLKNKMDIPNNAKAMLMVEVDGAKNELETANISVQNALKNIGLLQIDHANQPEQIKQLWSTRKALAPILRSIAKKRINEDIAVPVGLLPKLIEEIQTLSHKYNFQIVNFGHAGNGNLHTNILLNETDTQTLKRAHQCLSDLFKCVLELKGTLSGEHGVGLEKRDFVGWQINPATLRIMRKIKTVFDPKGILNPDKVFPLE